MTRPSEGQGCFVALVTTLRDGIVSQAWLCPASRHLRSLSNFSAAEFMQ